GNMMQIGEVVFTEEKDIIKMELQSLQKYIFRIGGCSMMRKAILFVSVILYLVNLTACYNKYRKGLWLDLGICASYAVPGMYVNELRGTYDYEIIETDSYGRILYKFEAKNVLTEKEEIVYVICQKNVSKYVYFYEDICYQFAQNHNDDLMELKERNDWECELDKEKMSRRESMVNLDHYIIEDCDLENLEVREVAAKEFGVTRYMVSIISFLDVDSEGKGMYLLSVEKDNEVTKYVAIVSTDYDISYMEAPNEVDGEMFSKFKKENGWKYGW
ncbi:MAG: hypothetical protein IJN87_00385, partial [Firmicutes bacterium]|nr:hypothetical protein [Bacillota bacterium]